MNPRGFLVVFMAAFFLALGAVSYAEESAFVKAFLEARETKNRNKMDMIVQMYKAKIPGEVDALITQASSPEASTEDREGDLFIAELIAKAYYDKFSDPGPMKNVKKAVFDLRLAEPVRSELTDGVHIVTFPKATDEVKNVFRPENIIIARGETVRWVNNDDIAHLFASAPLIGERGLFTPRIEPGGSWEYTFTKPGEYFYICFIHKGMIGKVTVEGGAEADGGAAGEEKPAAGEDDETGADESE